MGGFGGPRPLPEDRLRCLRAQVVSQRSGPCGPGRRAVRGTPKGLRHRQAPQSGSWPPAPRKRGTGIVKIPEGVPDKTAPILAGKPHVRGARVSATFQRFDASRLSAPPARPPQSKPCEGVPHEVRQGRLLHCCAGNPCGTGSREHSDRLAAERWPRKRPGSRGSRIRGFPKEAPVRYSTEPRSVEVRRWGLHPHQGGTQREIREYLPRGCPHGDQPDRSRAEGEP